MTSVQFLSKEKIAALSGDWLKAIDKGCFSCRIGVGIEARATTVCATTVCTGCGYGYCDRCAELGCHLCADESDGL